MDFLTTLIDADKLGGWVRAGLGALLATGIAKYPGLTDYLTPEMQAALGVFVSGLAVGLWSHIAKAYKDKK